jgi:hypothetical protein
MNHSNISDAAIDKAEHAHLETADTKLDSSAVEAAVHGHDAKWERKTIRKIDVRLLIIRKYYLPPFLARS